MSNKSGFAPNVYARIVQLESGLRQLGLDPALAEPLLAYLALLARWNATYNLTAGTIARIAAIAGVSGLSTLRRS